MESTANATRKKQKPNILIISVLLIAAAAMIAAGVIFMGPSLLKAFSPTPAPTTQSPAVSQTTSTTQKASEPVVPVTVLAGVSVNGIDVSGMTKADLQTATAKIPDSLLAKVAVSITVDGSNQKFTAKDLTITTDYEAVLEQVLAFGQTGTADERKQAAELAKSQGKAFTVQLVAQRDSIITALLPLKTKVDKAAVDATVRFMPFGYMEDGKPYQPDVRKLADAHSVGKNLDRPKLVQVSSAEKPSALRYQYWQKDHYVSGYIPADANISRFQYTPEADGKALDTGALADRIIAQVKSGTYAEITAATQVTKPAVKVPDLKKETILIASWTSSYRSHSSVSRNWNVSRMSSFINNNVIQPGETWSVNKTAGPRNAQTAKTIGWKEAAGILNGGYTEQEGGGVCQLGSTTFNAALRAGLIIVSSTHHTIPSDYVPLGLDATLSTPAPDLLLKNGNTRPVYLVSYVNPKDYNVTVEVYGQQPIDPKYGPVIYDYTSNNRGVRYGTPTMRTIFNATVAPDDTVLSALKPIYVYAQSRLGTQIQTYKRIYSLDGKPLTDAIPFENHKYPVINGTTYVFGSTLPTPTPTATPTSAPTATPTAAPPAVTPPPA